MSDAPQPRSVAARVALLEHYGIPGLAPDAVLDSITHAAACLCDTPIAAISIAAADRLFFTSCSGMSMTETARDSAFCSQAILTPDELLEVEDAPLDERFNSHPLVTGTPYVRFYAGYPLVTHEGFALGTLCVLDDKPRRLSEPQKNGLAQLAKAVMELLRERYDSRITEIDHVVERAPQDAVMITDATQDNSPITYVNRAFEAMTGYTRDEVLGRNPRFLQGRDTDPHVIEQLWHAVAEQRSCSVTLKNYRKDGTTFWNDLSVSPVRDAAGNTVSFVGVMRNASDRILARDQSVQLSRTQQEREQARASRNRLAQLVEDSANEIYVCDADSLQVLNANRAARENLGYSLAELQQLMPWDYVVGLTQDKVHELSKHLKTETLETHLLEASHRRKDGTTYPTSAHLQYMANQNPPVYAAIVQDITERQYQEQSVRLRERAIEALDVGVSIIDATEENNPLVYVNQTLCTMYGYSVDELIGQSAQIFQKGNPQQQQQLDIESALQKGESVQVLFESTRKDGSQFMNDLSLSPVHDPEGKLTHYIGINRDVTSRLEAEERSQRSRKIEAIGQLAGGIAHDFNNLLSVITGNLEFLESQITNVQHRDYLRKADSAARMSARMTRRLLSFAKQGQLEPTVLDANEHVSAAIELLRSTIGEHITLTSTLSSDLWAIRADASEVENTVVNLVINARDAMPAGGTIAIETKNVSVTELDADQAMGMQPGNYIRLSVADSGSGMNDEVKARVFEPFFTTRETSTGLGLATIYGFAKQSGGDVHILSGIDQGAIINVYLPACPELTVTPSDVEPVGAVEEHGVHRILVVEDNEMVRELTVERLHALGYDTEQANDGPAAVGMLKTDTEFDVILTDIVMEGGMSGYEVAQWVQKHLPQCKVLLTSGFNEQTAEASGMTIGTLQVLQKPYSMAELQQRINEVAGSDASNRALQ